MSIKVAVYGMFLDSTCLYAGITWDTYTRNIQHRTPKGRFRDRPEVKIRVLRWTTEANAARIESQVIAAYKRRGQCAMNRSRKSAYCINATRRVVKCMETGLKWPSVAAAARHFKVSDYTISEYLKYRGGVIWCRDFMPSQYSK